MAFPRNRAWVSPWGLKHTGFSDESDMGLRRRVQMSGSNEGYAFFFFWLRQLGRWFELIFLIKEKDWGRSMFGGSAKGVRIQGFI